MPVTIGSLFRRVVRVLQTQDDNPNSYLNNPNSEINNSSNSQFNKELRRNALRELVQRYLSDYLSTDQAEELVTEYIP